MIVTRNRQYQVATTTSTSSSSSSSSSSVFWISSILAVGLVLLQPTIVVAVVRNSNGGGAQSATTTTTTADAFVLPFSIRHSRRTYCHYDDRQQNQSSRPLLSRSSDAALEESSLSSSTSETTKMSSSSSSLSSSSSSFLVLPSTIPHPATNPDDEFFRSFRQRVPKRVQSWMRDSGMVRWIMDSLVFTAIPNVMRDYPWAISDFVRLTTPSNSSAARRWVRSFKNLIILPGVDRTKRSPTDDGGDSNTSTIRGGLRDDLEFDVSQHFYGPDRRQFVSLISSRTSTSPSSTYQDEQTVNHTRSSTTNSRKNERTIVVVHGGAWGSGFPSMYALTATPFLNVGYSHVAIVGYRTFPTTDVQGQLEDIAQALDTIGQMVMTATTTTSLHNNNNNNKMTVLAHSSGAHLVSMAFLEGRLSSSSSSSSSSSNNTIDQYIGMCGVYDIPSHYRFERARGIQRISPLAGACGYTMRNWKRASPLHLLREEEEAAAGVAADDGQLVVAQKEKIRGRFPRSTILLHGDVDTTVPYTSTKHFAEASGLDWRLLEETGHADVVLEMMFGGITQDTILQWIEEEDEQQQQQQQHQSPL